MHDLVAMNQFGRPQCEVVVLGAVEFRAEAADRRHDVAAVNAQVGDHVLRQQQLGIEVALEVWLVSPACLIESVVIGIENGGIGPAVDRIRHPVERIDGQHVVLAEAGHEVAVGHLQGGIGRGRDVAEFRSEAKGNPPVRGGVSLEQFPHPRRGGCVVGDTELPVWVDLATDRLDGGIEDFIWRVADGHHQRDQGSLLERPERRPQLCDPPSGWRVEQMHPVVILIGEIGAGRPSPPATQRATNQIGGDTDVGEEKAACRISQPGSKVHRRDGSFRNPQGAEAGAELYDNHRPLDSRVSGLFRRVGNGP